MARLASALAVVVVLLQAGAGAAEDKCDDVKDVEGGIVRVAFNAETNATCANPTCRRFHAGLSDDCDGHSIRFTLGTNRTVDVVSCLADEVLTFTLHGDLSPFTQQERDFFLHLADNIEANTTVDLNHKASLDAQSIHAAQILAEWPAGLDVSYRLNATDGRLGQRALTVLELDESQGYPDPANVLSRAEIAPDNTATYTSLCSHPGKWLEGNASGTPVRARLGMDPPCNAPDWMYLWNNSGTWSCEDVPPSSPGYAEWAYGNCFGRCGWGCGSGVFRQFTLDCADYDSCSRFVNEAVNCHNEFLRAVDDWMWSGNCDNETKKEALPDCSSATSTQKKLTPPKPSEGNHTFSQVYNSTSVIVNCTKRNEIEDVILRHYQNCSSDDLKYTDVTIMACEVEVKEGENVTNCPEDFKHRHQKCFEDNFPTLSSWYSSQSLQCFSLQISSSLDLNISTSEAVAEQNLEDCGVDADKIFTKILVDADLAVSTEKQENVDMFSYVFNFSEVQDDWDGCDQTKTCAFDEYNITFDSKCTSETSRAPSVAQETSWNNSYTYSDQTKSGKFSPESPVGRIEVQSANGVPLNGTCIVVTGSDVKGELMFCANGTYFFDPWDKYEDLHAHGYETVCFNLTFVENPETDVERLYIEEWWCIPVGGPHTMVSVVGKPRSTTGVHVSSSGCRRCGRGSLRRPKANEAAGKEKE